MNDILKSLNSEQIKPVTDTEGAVLVLAGAGSGKTRVLTSRIAYIIENNLAKPSAILAITFTNKAAAEMRERLSNMIEGAESMWICTIHSMCVRILRLFADRIGFNKNFSIYSETERANVIKKSFVECGFEDEKLLKNIKFHVANAKMLGLSAEEYYLQNKDAKSISEICKVYDMYCRHLKQNNALDFDDLLTETLRLLKKDTECREYLSGRFKYIHVDEFQDTNGVQYDIIRYLSYVHGNLFAVGDDDQSIYGWRGAKIENILNFERHFRGAKVYKLEQNYRSTKNILKLANIAIAKNKLRKSKELWTENDQGSEIKYYQAETEQDEALRVVGLIAKLKSQGYNFSDFAVLMRINALTRSFEQEFSKYNIPYKVFGGFKFYERKEIKDLLAYLRIINNPFDSEAVLRIINVPKRGIGAKTVQVLEDYATATNLSVYDAILDCDMLPLNAGSKAKLVAFGNLLKNLVIKGTEMSVDELIRDVINDSGILSMYEDNSDESINKKANIDEFVNSIDDFVKLNKNATLADFLNQVTLSSDTDEMDNTEYVTLATIHSVKGLEFKNVFVAGLEENIMPVSRASLDDSELEEERRLMYVAITRAKENLFLTRSKSRYLYGERSATLQSRFITELSSALEIEEKNANLGYSERGYSNRTSSQYQGYSRGAYQNRNTYKYNYEKDDDYGYQSDVPSSNNFSPSSAYRGAQTYSKPYERNSAQTYSVPKPPARSTQAYGVKPQKDLSKFKIGVKVNHAKFGVGMIVGVKGVGSNLILDVSFKGLGIKQLSAGLAPLEII